MKRLFDVSVAAVLLPVLVPLMLLLAIAIAVLLGRPVLFVDREFTLQLNDLPKEEGKALLEFLFSHTERVDFQCRFRWTENAIAIWDNRAVLHHAMWDYWPAEREGRRISVVGEKPEPWRLERDQAAERVATTRLTL